MRYSGAKCPVCEKEFTEDDDIVVCPECGTPHHRECYQSVGGCANAERHAENWKWEKSRSSQSVKICPVCRFPNKYEDTVCQKCGTLLPDSTDNAETQNNSGMNGQQWREGISMPDAEELANPIKFLGLDPNEDMGGATVKEVTEFVGPGTIYYLPKFKKMKEDGAKPSFNIFSLFFPTLFFANRKMWGWAILAAVLGILFNLPAKLLLLEDLPADIASFLSSNKSTLEMMNDIFVVADIGVRVLFCLFANWFYFRFSLHSLKKIKKNRGSLACIRTSGGIKPLNMLLIILIQCGISMLAFSGMYMVYEMMTTIQDLSTLCIR